VYGNAPDLTQVPVEGQQGKKKWLLQMSMNGAMQYFVGEFDGVKFTNENPADKIFRPDYGPDYYAAICYGQLPNNHKPVSVAGSTTGTMPMIFLRLGGKELCQYREH
jgi:fructan beta-fructosidase